MKLSLIVSSHENGRNKFEETDGLGTKDNVLKMTQKYLTRSSCICIYLFNRFTFEETLSCYKYMDMNYLYLQYCHSQTAHAKKICFIAGKLLFSR